MHALGTNAEGRDDFNDGKARTFIPLVRDEKPVPTALVLQLRARVLFSPDGRIDRPDLWAASLAHGRPVARRWSRWERRPAVTTSPGWSTPR